MSIDFYLSYYTFMMLLNMKNRVFLNTLLLFLLWCFVGSVPRTKSISAAISPTHITFLKKTPFVTNPDFEPGDIIVKPNNNWLPGTSAVESDLNYGFGHAVLVIGSKKKSANRVETMMNTTIMEATSRIIPRPFQVRTTNLLLRSKDSCLVNDSFDEAFRGNRYRLRLKLSENQKKKLFALVQQQNEDYFSWRSLKNIPSNKQLHDNRSWYCSLLIWYSFYKTIGIDLDANKGWYVYPNDLINSPYFANTPTDSSRIIRF